MDSTLNTSSPLSYTDWNNALLPYSDNSQQKYLTYLNKWYENNNKNKTSVSIAVSSQYVQLIKDVRYLFNTTEQQDLFLTDIDFNKKEDLIYVIPYIVQKLKEVSQIICAKREELKYAKTKQSMIGSNQALEKILYEYVLKNFTKKDYSYTRVPISSLQNLFPTLSSISDDFFIEVEELFDTNTYFDSDPSVDISEYFNINDLMELKPFENLSENELTGLLTTRFLKKVSDTPLSTVFSYYINSLSTTLSSVSSVALAQLNNQLVANQEYLGENVYALTAIRTSDLNIPDYSLNLKFEQGNNWFYWPSGSNISNYVTIGNIYQPIPLNSSNFINNRIVNGSSYVDSDLFFTDKNGTIQGAWLQGNRTENATDTMSINIQNGEKRQFIYPFVGFDIDSKSFEFKNYSLNDDNRYIFKALPKETQINVLNNYYNNILPVSAAFDIYLNQTSLLSAGANAGYFSDQADTIIKRISCNNFDVFSDANYADTEAAFLYKFDETEIYVTSGDNQILWPIGPYSPNTSIIPITIDSNTCLPINLSDINPKISMVGSIAGTTMDTSDVIYKNRSRGGSDPIEAAWLGTGSISQLDILTNAIPIYSTSAVNCADYLDGPILSSLSFIATPGEYVSFIWMDKDTPADEVFTFRPHAAGCFYGKTFPHNFFKNQDYQNFTPLNDSMDFPLTKNPCTCRSVYYSPIGSQADTPDQYNGMMDYLFADPQGVGSNLNLKTWVDTRNLDAFSSPQFAFYKLDGNYDQEVGFGTGKWQTGNGLKMILKTGRRYTYYRTNLRKSTSNKSVVPYLLTNYSYKQISVNCPIGYKNKTDIVLLLDNSRTQGRTIEYIKGMASDLCTKILSNNADVNIALVSFNKTPVVYTLLEKNITPLLQSIQDIPYYNKVEDYPKWLTDINSALTTAKDILFNNKPYDNSCSYGETKGLCSDLSRKIIYDAGIASDANNCPRPDAAKKIIIFSDGQETVNIGKAVPEAITLKNLGVEIICLDIGVFSDTNTVMQDMASNKDFYNLEKTIKMTDYNEYDLNQYIALKTVGCFPALPTWCKAIKNSAGSWIATNEPSDMVLNPGDFITYNHQGKVTYTSQNGHDINLYSIDFTINKELNGWDYANKTFSLSAIGDGFGAKPFWGKMYVKDEQDFTKKTIYFGGHIRFINDYVPIHQPPISDLKFTNGCFVEYKNIGTNNINWKEELSFNVYLTSQQWNKLIINENYSNLAFALQTKNLEDLIVDYSYEPTDILLESYSQFKPAFYNFYLRNSAFNYTENLYYLSSCSQTFVTFITGKVLSVTQPHANMENIHFPTLATIDFPASTVSTNQISYYLTPDKLGATFYRGRGYTMDIDSNSLTQLDVLSGERLFLDINKYGSRNRGLTKKDQLSPVVIKDIDNRWMIQPFTSGLASGIIVDTVQNQKMTPYMSNYETDLFSDIGLSTQNDSFNFWNTDYNNWSDDINYPLNLRKELNSDVYNKRVKSLLVDRGVLDIWKTDIYGNNFGLFKN